jgi:glycosyltransferase involved in cell wall biosynthesis
VPKASADGSERLLRLRHEKVNGAGKMRVGIDATSLGGGRGPARYTREVIKALAKCCAGDDLFHLYSPFKISIENLPGNFIKCMVPRQGHLPWLNWTLPQRAKKDKIDVMFFPANDFWLWPFIPTVVTMHDVAPATILRGYYRSWADRMQNKLQMERLGNVAKMVITVSIYSSNQIHKEANVPTEKLCVIYNGVSSKYCPPAPGKERGDFILYVGGFDRRKNLDRLLDAYNILLKSGATEKLVMAGHSKPGGHNRLYYDITELLQSKNLTGKVEIIENPTDDKIVQLYQTAKVFVFPSMIEGFGLPVLEAMACGCPVACSNAASLPEVGGDAVMYFDPYDVRAMASVIQSIMNDESRRKDLIEKGLARAAGFGWAEAGQAVYDTIKRVYLNNL